VRYAQFCPVAKASEVIGERWMLLVLRELVSGASSFTELQRGLGHISPSVLSSRIRTLTEHGIIERVQRGTGKAGHYRLTRAGSELGPIIHSIGSWGQRWVRSRMSRDELDVELLMLHIGRNLDARAFPKDHAVVSFVFSDLYGASRRWWLLLEGGDTELCNEYPGRIDDVTLTCTLRTMAEVFNGDISLRAALAEGRLEIAGPRKLASPVQRWLGLSPFASAALARASSTSAR
jgi:DNA-binding HxlR family transcriptional regulator